MDVLGGGRAFRAPLPTSRLGCVHFILAPLCSVSPRHLLSFARRMGNGRERVYIYGDAGSFGVKDGTRCAPPAGRMHEVSLHPFAGNEVRRISSLYALGIGRKCSG